MPKRSERRADSIEGHTVGADAAGAQISLAARQTSPRDATSEYYFCSALVWNKVLPAFILFFY